jgi:5'-methylthioadenosine phosphorylase
MTLPRADIAVIGGSGVYDLPELENRQWLRVESSFGTPSDEFLFGTVRDVSLVFVPRHGRGHVLSPSAINYRANIDALKRVGVQDVISVSAVGSLVDDLPPGTFVLVDQYVDRTVLRESTFFGVGCVAHVSMAHPTCSQLSQLLHRAALDSSLPCRLGGTYLAMEGPQFSSQAESNLYRSWDCHVIGMTNMPEAKLAREAELCYSSICMVTDYDCWHPQHESVTVADVVRVMGENSRNAQRLLLAAIPLIPQAQDRASWHGRRALENAIITSESARDQTMVKRLSAVAGRVLGHHE